MATGSICTKFVLLDLNISSSSLPDKKTYSSSVSISKHCTNVDYHQISHSICFIQNFLDLSLCIVER